MNETWRKIFQQREIARLQQQFKRFRVIDFQRIQEREGWITRTLNFLSRKDNRGRWIGITNVRQMLEHVATGHSGTCAESLSRLSGMGYSKLIDTVQTNMTASDAQLEKIFKPKTRIVIPRDKNR
jgi:hypothetical protein